MTEMKKVSVFLRTGEHGLDGVQLEGANLKVFVDDGDEAYSRLLRVNDGDDTIAEFQNWDYWKKIKDE